MCLFANRAPGVPSGQATAGELRAEDKQTALPREAARRRPALGVVAVPGLRAGPGWHNERPRMIFFF